MTFDDFYRRLEHLRLDRSGGLVKPYKPVLLAAVVLLVHKGKLPSRSVFLDGGLRSALAGAGKTSNPQFLGPIIHVTATSSN